MGNFGETLRRLRKKQKLSQDELGALAGLNGQTISNIETGTVQEPMGDSYRRIAKALGMAVDELAREVDKDLMAVEIPRDRYAVIAENARHNGKSVEDFIWARCQVRTTRLSQRGKGGGGANPGTRKNPTPSPRP